MEKLIDALKRGDNINISELCPDLTTDDIKKLMMSALLNTRSSILGFSLKERKDVGSLDLFKIETEKLYYHRWLKNDKKFDYQKERVLNLEVDPFGEENWEETKPQVVPEKKLSWAEYKKNRGWDYSEDYWT